MLLTKKLCVKVNSVPLRTYSSSRVAGNITQSYVILLQWMGGAVLSSKKGIENIKMTVQNVTKIFDESDYECSKIDHILLYITKLNYFL